MGIEKDRLISLIEFAQQSALMRSKPSLNVTDHGLFALFEHQVQGLPGVRLNANDTENEDEVWFAIKRSHETKPPEIGNTVLKPWIQLTQSPNEEPKLRESIDRANLIPGLSAIPPEQGQAASSPPPTVSLVEYEKADQVRSQFSAYRDTRWQPWAEEEKLRRKTVRLYSQLFTLMQQLEGGIIETQIELVLGVGIGIWNFDGTIISHPILGQLVEVSLNSKTAEMEIRPRDVEARLEIDWYASVGNPGVANLEKAAKEFFGNAKTTFSPFDRATFEPLLRTASTNLDANGVYWPDATLAEDRTLPKPDDKLKVTDTWVLFARPRTNSLFVQDLEKLKKSAQEADTYPAAVAAIVTAPSTSNPVVTLPSYRGVSASYHTEPVANNKKSRDLYFPKPFNDEQVRIIQLLDVFDGVVVQGPPGTGKTHTIANVICHYLAEGKRVLVSSMKDPALAVLQEHLPAEIRPLAISLLSSEQDGMKQFEHAINKIASEVQSIDRSSTARTINHLEASIDGLHGTLATTDYRIASWAKLNLSKITLSNERIDPQDAAREVVGSLGQFEWITDTLGISPEFEPQFTDEDVVRLREARRILGADIEYLTARLPQIIEFPDAKTLLEVHQDLSHFEKLKREIENGELPALSDSSQETLAYAQQLLVQIEKLRSLRSEMTQANRSWRHAIHERLCREDKDDLLILLEALGTELERAIEIRKKFMERPCSTSEGIELDSEIIEAIGNLATCKSPFGLKGIFGKSEAKRQIDSIRVLGARPADPECWQHVADYLAFLKVLRELALRWNALAKELQLELVESDKPEGGLAAAKACSDYLKVKAAVLVENQLCTSTARIFPTWANSGEVRHNLLRLSELETALRHHLTKSRLAHVWANKEKIQKVLQGKEGPIVESIRSFFGEVLGNPLVADATLQTQWSALMVELSRVLGLDTLLITVREVCRKVEISGAPQYARALRQPTLSAVDSLLPDNWRSAWRLRRLNTCLESTDSHEELKQLAKERREVENDLSRAYREIVAKRTWLKLAENASPSIRAALQAYLAAIQKIGKDKGKGKRAVRYRSDARLAASQANPAVPCWIMAHYRVSESLPAELGCFDLVVIDEASQSDLSALPALLRAQKVLIVGDDKQVSPEGVGLEEEKIRSLMNRFLGNQITTYRAQMSPERSIYDLFKVVFAMSAVMLKEHFRSVGPIIEYSKREFYNHELRPLRLPKASERLDPPLIDVLVEDGYRRGDTNQPEARFIVNEIKTIVADPRLIGRSIGVVSLLADKQALLIWERLADELGPEVMQRHHIACGDARTFQGKERDIMFLSMVSAPNEVGAPLSRDTFVQRFNVAASRARDRMYLVRSVELGHLSEADRCRRSLIKHFSTPYAQDEVRSEDLRSLCESPFEREVYDELTQRGYLVTPQVKVGQYRIDLVVEGHNDSRLAVECDGDKYHGTDKWSDDMQRQRILERAGWVFWRCFASAFISRRKDMLSDLLKTLSAHGIDPIGADGAPRSIHTEHRVVSSTKKEGGEGHGATPAEMPDMVSVTGDTFVEIISAEADSQLIETQLHSATNNGQLSVQVPVFDASAGTSDVIIPLSEYQSYVGPSAADPRSASAGAICDGMIKIIEMEGPVLAKRVYDIYLRGCGIQRMGHELKKTMNRALAHGIRAERLIFEDELATGGFLFSIVRIKGSPPIKLRRRGPRTFDEIPPSEIQALARSLLKERGFIFGSDEHVRAVMDCLELKRLTTQVGTTFREALKKSFAYLD